MFEFSFLLAQTGSDMTIGAVIGSIVTAVISVFTAWLTLTFSDRKDTRANDLARERLRLQVWASRIREWAHDAATQYPGLGMPPEPPRFEDDDDAQP